MARLSRITPPDHTPYFAQCDNYRQLICRCGDDRALYAHWIRESAEVTVHRMRRMVYVQMSIHG